MARRIIIRTICPYCKDFVEQVPDKVLREKPHANNVEYVVTHTGYKQYFHTSCWNEMIEKQKEKIKEGVK